MFSHSANFDNSHELFLLTKRNDYLEIVKIKKAIDIGHLHFRSPELLRLHNATVWRPSSCVECRALTFSSKELLSQPLKKWYVVSIR